MKTKFLVFIFFSFFSLMLSAQNTTCDCCISGKILDKEKGTPIPYATIVIKDTEKYAVTNETGDFTIKNACPDTYVLVISSLGYTSLTTSQQQYKRGIKVSFSLSEDTTSLNEVTVQGEKRREKGTETIAQITLSKEDITSIPTGTLAASLARVDGVTFASTGTNVQIPVIQGLSGNRILILNNGIKHAFQNWGTDHAPEIDINSANKITVIKGAAGVRFGPEALSGAILIEPNPLTLDNPFYGNVSASYETNGRGYNTNIALGQGTENWSYFVNGNYTKIGDRQAPDYNLTNTGKEENSFGFGVRHKKNDFDIKVFYNYINQDLGLLRASYVEGFQSLVDAFNADVPNFTDSFSYNIREPNQETEHHFIKGQVDWKYADDAKLSFRTGIQLNQRKEFDVRRNEERPIIDLDLLTYDYQLEWEHPTWKGFDGFIGVQYFTQNNDNNPGTFNLAFIPNYNTDRLGVFVIEKFKFGKEYLEVGARFDVEANDVRGREPNQDVFRDDYTFTNFTASLGYSWKLSNDISAKTNIGSAFRTPNVAELYSFGQHGPRSVFGLLRFTDNNGVPSTDNVTPLDDSDVDLERGYKFANEFRIDKNDGTHILTTYAHYIDNFVFERPIGVTQGFGGPNTAFFVDQADAMFVGLDYTWKQKLSESLNMTFGFSYLWSKNIGEDEPLIYQPPINTNLELQWNQGDFLIFTNSTWSIRPSYTFEQFQAPRVLSLEDLGSGNAQVTTQSEIFDFTEAPEGYFLLDLSWNFEWKKFNAGITVQNILDKSYRNYLNDFRYFADEPGRNIIFSLNYNL
ncbi:MAG: TonB-dependent receptor [Bacteroidota bacterium]